MSAIPASRLWFSHEVTPHAPSDASRWATSVSDAYWIISEHLQAVHDRYQARPNRTPEALTPTLSRPIERMPFNIRRHTTSKDPR
ncbi:hypothetical protein [Nonomuraea dietziae]|uniref:hypothetical protein n=1 Tax=Nonomuraea dietziae TaxID=65515 RepID=UPI0033FFA045